MSWEKPKFNKIKDLTSQVKKLIDLEVERSKKKIEDLEKMLKLMKENK